MPSYWVQLVNPHNGHRFTVSRRQAELFYPAEWQQTAEPEKAKRTRTTKKKKDA